MKKITILSLHLGVGGIEKYLSNLCKMLKNDYQINLIITYKINEKPSFDFDKNIKIDYLIDGKSNKEEIKKYLKGKRIFLLIREIFKAIKILYMKRTRTIKAIKSLDCDYVITTRTYETKLVNKYLKKKGIIKIATDHNYPTNKYKNKLIKSISNYDKLVVVNDEIKDIYFKEIGNKVICINNFIDYISPIVHNTKSKKLIAVGRFSKEKGFTDLIDIMSLIVKKDKNITLTLVGDGEEYSNISKKIEELNLKENVFLTGYLSQDKIEKLMIDSGAYLMTSYSESFGLVILDAMNYGLPIIAFDSASGPRILLKETGILIKHRNKEEYTNAVVDILNDESKMNELSIKSKEKIVKYSMENIREEYMKLLNSLECKSNKKVMFISSTGGHLSEMLMLKKMFEKYEYLIITENTPTNVNLKNKFGKNNVGYLIYGTPKHKFKYIFKLTANCFKSLYYYLKFKPGYIVTTGAHTAGPMCCIGKIFGSKIIFIESFANSETRTKTGNIVYKFADLFIVQWEDMIKVYPKAVYGGWIY